MRYMNQIFILPKIAYSAEKEATTILLIFISSYSLIIILKRLLMKIMSLYEDKVKSSSPAYKRREPWDKRPLGRGTNRSWYRIHTTIKLSLSPCTSAAAYELPPLSTRVAAAQSMEPWTVTKKLYTSV